MKQEIAARWIEALRSGRYVQGTGSLITLEGGTKQHCCLGVLCEIAEQDGIITRFEGRPYDAVVYFPDGKDEDGFTRRGSGVLPKSVMLWAEMRSSEGRVADPSGEESDAWLSSLNDGGMPFEEIASLIELNINEL